MNPTPSGPGRPGPNSISAGSAFVSMKSLAARRASFAFWWFWDTCCLVLSLVLCFTIGWEVCMIHDPVLSLAPAFAGWLAFDYTCDAFFLVDFLIRTRHVVASGGCGTRRGGGVLLLCFLSTFPVDLVSGLAGGLVAPLRLNRLLRLFLFNSYAKTITDALNSYLSDDLTNPMVNRLPKLFLAMFFASHWVGSLFHLMALAEAKQGIVDTWASGDGLWTVARTADVARASNVNVTYTYNLNNTGSKGMAIIPGGGFANVHGAAFIGTAGGATVHRVITFAATNTTIIMTASQHGRYLRGLYWAVITMVTVGFGDVIPYTIAETLFTAFIMVVGAIIACMTIANLTNYVVRVGEGRGEEERGLGRAEGLGGGEGTE